MTLYSCKTVQKILNQYAELNGVIEELEEGSLGYGLIVCHGSGLKTCVITEKFLNSWTSGHTIRFYNKMPKKYQKMIDNLAASFE